MAANITITIPNELRERLQKVKQKFNVSKVCQEAIEVEVNRQELLTKGLEKKENVIIRLKTEKTEYIKHYYDLGYKVGIEICNTIRYRTLIELVNLSLDQKVKYIDTEPTSKISLLLINYICSEGSGEIDLNLQLTEEVDLLSNLAMEYVELLHTEDAIEEYQSCSPELALFAKGWLKAVQDFYAQIKDLL
ncbi:MAG TPA: hypothetical protein PKB02_02220 [Anaerohalosphaeraceae bacterium]|nr:hypothetical protein [Anaerohalosphaeraceae bacterium]